MTKDEASPKSRWYDDACGTALALEIVGERWSLLIVRELMFGPRRFGEIKAHLSNISANVLTQRLEGLERAGIVQRRKLPSPASVQVYELTPWGYESEPIFQEMGRWALRSPAHDPTLPLSPASFMMSLRTMLNHERAAGETARVGFKFAADAFVGELSGGQLSIRRAEADDADFTFVSDPTTLVFTFYGRRPFSDGENAGRLRVEGDRAAAERFVGLFPLPTKI